MLQNDRRIAEHALKQANLRILKLTEIKTLRSKKVLLAPLFKSIEKTEDSIARTEADLKNCLSSDVDSLRDELANHIERLHQKIQNFLDLTLECPNNEKSEITPLRALELSASQMLEETLAK
jgi:hypothetical protein